MELRRLCNFVVHFSFLATVLFSHCDARSWVSIWRHQSAKLQKDPSEVDLFSNSINSRFNLPPFESLAPIPSLPPSTPPTSRPTSPLSYAPPPPLRAPTATTPPGHFSSPPYAAPRPPISQPPPSAQAPPPHKSNAGFAVWCVAKPTVPDSILQAAMDYACGSGADCKSIQLNGPCFQPNTLISHSSYAFNSYWQTTKAAGGTCDFGGTAMLVTVDPSFDRCRFLYN